MNIKRDIQKRAAEAIKAAYPKGTRILLVHMGEDPNPIPPMTRGTVIYVDDIGTIHCRFDNGRSLGLIFGIDDFRGLTEQEIKAE